MYNLEQIKKLRKDCEDIYNEYKEEYKEMGAREAWNKYTEFEKMAAGFFGFDEKGDVLERMTPVKPQSIKQQTTMPQMSASNPTSLAPTSMPSTQNVPAMPSYWNEAANRAKCAANGYAQGVTYGWADEMAGAAAIGGNMAANLMTGQNAFANSGDAYSQVRDEWRNNYANCQQQYPVMMAEAEALGAASNPLTWVGRGAYAPRNVRLQNEMLNNTINAVNYGLGSGEGSFGDHLQSVGQNVGVANFVTPLRRNYANAFVPTIGGGAAGNFARSYTDNSMQNLMNHSIDYFSK